MDGMTGGVIGGETALAFAAGAAGVALGATTTPGADGAAGAVPLGFALDAVAGWTGTGGADDATGGSSGAIDAAAGVEADAAAVGRAEACASGALSPFLNSLHPLRVSESSTVDANMPFTIDWGPAKRRSMRHITPMSSDSSKRKWHWPLNRSQTIEPHACPNRRVRANTRTTTKPAPAAAHQNHRGVAGRGEPLFSTGPSNAGNAGLESTASAMSAKS
jgi:hypothetical protein